jgi:2-C-methyl-D-erythritol 4-phosphate cytidylyltransferase
MPRVGAIVVAAGSSSRMQGVDKLYAVVAGRPLLAHTLRAFECTECVGEIVVVVAAAEVQRAADLAATAGATKVTAIVAGGARRQDSVACGLARLGVCDLVAVQDGARPLLSAEIIARGIEVAGESCAAVAAVPVVDTIKEVGEARLVQRTLDRGRLWAIQTPQIFERRLLERAHREVREDVTDDAAMVERLGVPVAVFMGSYDNLKVTTPSDLVIADALLRLAGDRGCR